MAAVATNTGPVYQRIVSKLTAALRPSVLTLKDQSHLHAHHAQSPKRPETHFDLHVVSNEFEGMPLLQRQRKIYEILTDEMAASVHALSMTTRTPSEQEQKQ